MKTLAFSPYLQLPALLSGLDYSLGYTYTSQIENVELNGLFRINCRPLLGTRLAPRGPLLYFADHFTLTGIDDASGATEQLDYHTTNNLVGVQTGLLLVHGWSRYRWEAGLKLGLMVNTYHQNGTDTVSDPQGIPAGFQPTIFPTPTPACRPCSNCRWPPRAADRLSLAPPGIPVLRHDRPGPGAAAARRSWPRRLRGPRWLSIGLQAMW